MIENCVRTFPQHIIIYQNKFDIFSRFTKRNKIKMDILL